MVERWELWMVGHLDYHWVEMTAVLKAETLVGKKAVSMVDNLAETLVG